MSATTSPRPAVSDAAEPRRGLPGFFAKFAVLGNAHRELWLVFGIKFLMFAAYGLTNSTIKLWLSWDFGYSDKQALALVAAWSLSMTAITLVVGSLTDAIGFRKAFFLGTGLCILGRGTMALASVRWLALGGGLLPLAIGEALGTPVLIASVRRYSNTKQRSISFSIIYAMGNVGFLVANYIFDFFRGSHGMGEHGHFSLFGMQISTYRALFLASLALEVAVLPLLYFLRKGVEVTDEGLRINPEPARDPEASLWKSFWPATRDSLTKTGRIFAGLVKENGFYRLLAFLIFIAFLKLIFMQMYYVFPTFGIRELGEGAPVGKLWAINSYFAILLVPIVGALTQRFSAYAMVVLGGIISAVSVFIMVLPTEWFQSAADGYFGHLIKHIYLGLSGPVHPYYVMIALFVVLLSVGEAFYSPRVYEYAAAIAPRGQEASYGALSYVPFLLAKLLIGTFSGFLLEKYCPEVGPKHSSTMWLAVALTASIAPIGLLALRRYIRVHEAGRQG